MSAGTEDVTNLTVVDCIARSEWCRKIARITVIAPIVHVEYFDGRSATVGMAKEMNLALGDHIAPPKRSTHTEILRGGSLSCA